MDLMEAVVVGFFIGLFQIMPDSPLDTHPQTMLIGISAFLLYCFAHSFGQNIPSNFAPSGWPAVEIINNFTSFCGCISVASFASIVYGTSSLSLAVVSLFIALWFSGMSALALIRHRNSIAMTPSDGDTNLQVQVGEDSPDVDSLPA